MNTIPSTFNDGLPAYTVVGGAKRNASTGLCAVLLSRGGRYARNSCFKELQNSGFDYVLSMESSGEHFDIEELSSIFPFIRFILFKETPNLGQQINVAAAEADTPLFFVLWNDFHPVLPLDAERIARRLGSNTAQICALAALKSGNTNKKMAADGFAQQADLHGQTDLRGKSSQLNNFIPRSKPPSSTKLSPTPTRYFASLRANLRANLRPNLSTPMRQGASFAKVPETVNSAKTGRQCVRLCTAVVLQNQQFETLPSAIVPVINGKKFETIPFTPVKEGEPSLYPFDAAGVYDRVSFIDLGGFDPKISQTHWQLLDFGLRAWLWGEEIRCSQQLRFKLDYSIGAETSTTGNSYLRFFLKNLAPVIQSGNMLAKAKNRPAFESASAHLPLRCLPAYLFKAGCGLMPAINNFIEIRRWVDANSPRFVNSISDLSSFWPRQRV